MSTRPTFRIFAAAALLLGASSFVEAVPCFEIIDSGNNVTYRSSVPPVALSGPEWESAQQRYSKSGQHLRWYETQYCSSAVSAPPRDESDSKEPAGFDPNVVLRATAPFKSPTGSFGLPRK